ncbi:MAG: hypothetical protein ACYTBP_03230 [Planctomycetota bacterium]|jgi:hypothetical protein
MLVVIDVLIIRIKQAECALADGRLDEAFEIAQAEDVRRHHRGQKLIGKLTRALVKRGQDSLSANRLGAALNDCNKADKLGGNLTEITKLRQAICTAMEANRLRHQQRSLKLAQAKEHIENGWLSVGEQILVDGSGGDEADMLLQQATVKRLQMDSAVSKARQALERNDLEFAIDIISKVDAASTHNETVAEVIAQIKTLANQDIRDNLINGRIDLANSLLRKLLLLDAESVETRELSSAVTQCLQAADLVEAGESQAAAQILQKLKTILPSAKWLQTAISQAQKAAEAAEALHTGPLGLFTSNNVGGDDLAEQNSLPSLGNNTKEKADSQLPSKFVLQIDGVGSFLVFRDKTITAGPISSSARPDLGLLAEPTVPVVSIERTDEDYFLHSQKPVYINDKPVTKKLLGDSDGIALSAKCRMKFSVPNAASTTAVLDLDGARLPRPDVRRIILMDRDILIGSGLNNHIRTERVKNTVTLFMQNGKLDCRAKEKVMVNDQAYVFGTGFPIGSPIQIGRISLVLTKLDV